MAILVPALASCQTVFKYFATDYKTITATQPGPLTISVGTLIIVQADPSTPVAQVATRTFIARFRPPQTDQPRLIQATVENRAVGIQILRSNIDGEMEAAVEIPISAGPNPTLKIDWNTKNSGVLETSIEPTLQVLDSRLRSQKSSVRYHAPTANDC